MRDGEWMERTKRRRTVARWSCDWPSGADGRCGRPRRSLTCRS